MKKFLTVAAVALTAIWSVPAAAVPVTSWSYTVTSAWVPGQTLFGSGGGTQVNNASVISWGNTSQAGDPLALGQDRSGIEISGSPASGTVFTNGPAGATQTISHTNNPISGSYATLLSTQLTTSLTLSPLTPNPPFDGSTPIGPDQTVNFNITFSETSNVNSCGFVSASSCDDIFVIDGTQALNTSFQFDGETYFASIVPLAAPLVPLPAATCLAAGHTSPCLGFQTPESAVTPVPFGFLITSTPVSIPEPGTLALAGLALLGAGLTRRRTRKS